MFKNNLIIELLKIEIKKNRMQPKDIFSIGFNDGKKELNELSIGLTLDVSTFDCNLIEEQIEELVNCKVKYKIEKNTVCGLYINNVMFNKTNGIVNFTMFKYHFDDLKKKCL